MRKILVGVGVVAALVLAGCASSSRYQEPAKYEGAMKMNQLSIGMTKAQVIGVMGPPVSSTAKNNYECIEYKLIKHNSNYYRTIPDSYYIVLHNGRTLEYGEGACYTSRFSSFEYEEEEAAKKSKKINLSK